MSMHIITFTYEIGISRPDTHPVENDLDRKIRTELGLNQVDKYEILHVSQSQQPIDQKALLVISMVIEVK